MTKVVNVENNSSHKNEDVVLLAKSVICKLTPKSSKLLTHETKESEQWVTETTLIVDANSGKCGDFVENENPNNEPVSGIWETTTVSVHEDLQIRFDAKDMSIVLTGTNNGQSLSKVIPLDSLVKGSFIAS